MNKRGILSVLLSAAMVSASISTAAVYAEEVRFELPECLIQSLNKENNYKTGTYITNDYVNYRQGYSTAFETYGIIPKGTKVEVTEVFNGWGKINYNGKTAWFKLEYGDYVQPQTQTTTTAVTTTALQTGKLGIYVTNGDVYYRKGHSNNDAAYGVIPKGTKVEILEIYQGWGRINYDGKDSWFYLKFADFLSEAKITNPATTTTTTTTITATTTTETKPVTTTTAVTPPLILPLDLNFSEGDIDANGVVDASDASTILAYYAQIQTGGVSWFNAKQILFADVNNDKVIDASDASLILFYYSYASTTKDFISMREMMACNFNPPAVTTPLTTTSEVITTTTTSAAESTETTAPATSTSEETTTSTTTTSEETTTSTTTTSETTTTTTTVTTTTTTTPPVTTTTYKYPLAAKTLDSVGWKLENAFKAASSITYYGQKSDMPQDDKTSMEWYAEYGFKNGKGNCYVMAAMFCEMAQTLGYDAHMISGKVPLRVGGFGPHSWVEIEENGKIYVYDPDFANETNKNGFKIEYGQSGTWKYTVEKRMN